jgi:beta-lactamase class A
MAAGYVVNPQQVKIRGLSPTRWTVQVPAPTVDPTATIVPTVSTPTLSTPTLSTDNGIRNSSNTVGNRVSNTMATATPSTPTLPSISPTAGDPLGGLVPSGRQLNWLQQRLASLQTGAYSRLGTGMFFLDMETGNFLDINGDKVYPTASIIKLPILIALFQDVDAGKIDLNETLTMTSDVIVGGSGDMQTMRSGSKFSLLETATKMIVISDNTATNMIIKRMGGIQYLNERFRRWGLQKTVIRNYLPDLKGTNTTTPRELTQLLAMLDQQRLLSPRSQAQALDILRRVRNRTLLPVGLGRGATIAHKTGDIGFILGDAGIIQMPTGKRYLASILVESAYDDPSARDFIQDVSRIVYTYLSQSGTTASIP